MLKYLLNLVSGLIVILVVGFGVNSLRNYLVSTNVPESYDFSESRSDKNLGRGPKIGEKIEMSFLRNEDGNPFVYDSPNQVMLLAIIDPDCKAYRVAEDQITEVQRASASNGIDFSVISFTFSKKPQQFFNLVEPTYKYASTYLWASDEKMPAPQLMTMVVPSFILIDRKGEVLQTFPGTSSEKEIRKRIANQIIIESLEKKAEIFMKQ